MIEQERRTQKVLSENKQCTSCGKSFVSGEAVPKGMNESSSSKELYY